MVEIVAVDVVVHLDIFIECSNLKLSIPLIDSGLQFRSGEDEVLYAVIVEVGGENRAVGGSVYPLAVAHVVVDSPVRLVDEVHQSVGIEVKHFGRCIYFLPQALNFLYGGTMPLRCAC